MTQGDSLARSFNQDDAEAQRSTQAKFDDQAEGLKRKKANDLEAIKHIKVGNIVSYTKGEGVIVKKSGAYVTIYNESADTYDQVHIGETYIPGDTISMGVMNQLWNQMALETRQSLLSKSGVEPTPFIGRTWLELPMALREVLKLSPHYVSVGSKWVNPPKGAVQDKAPGGKPKTPKVGGAEVAANAAQATGQTKRTPQGTKVFREVDGKQVGMTERQAASHDRGVKERKIAEDAMADFKAGRVSGAISAKDTPAGTKKSDVEHGAYGGVVTDTPFDATCDYEEKPRNFSEQFKHEQQQKKPRNLKEESHETYKSGIQDGSADEEVTKEGGGAATAGAVSTSTEGAFNAVNDEKKIRNKYNTRSGPRQATKEEIERYLNKNK